MKTLREVLADVDTRHIAVGHFNISELAALKGIFSAAQELTASYGAQIPVLIGVSEGEREFIGVRQAAALVKSLREEYDYPIFLNADHTHTVAGAKAAIDAGYPSVHIDLSKLPFVENIRGTADVVRYARKVGREISIEGELGALATDSSTIYKKKIKIDRLLFGCIM